MTEGERAAIATAAALLDAAAQGVTYLTASFAGSAAELREILEADSRDGVA